MISLETIIHFIRYYIPYGKEIKSSAQGPYFYNEQVYRDEESYYSSNTENDIELGITDAPIQVISYY
jgi:hypothetical protein